MQLIHERGSEPSLYNNGLRGLFWPSGNMRYHHTEPRTASFNHKSRAMSLEDLDPDIAETLKSLHVDENAETISEADIKQGRLAEIPHSRRRV